MIYTTTVFDVPTELVSSVEAWALVQDNQCQLLTVELGETLCYRAAIHDLPGTTDQAGVFAREFGLTARTQ